MTDQGNSTPEFTVALRGYDREQVDEHITRLRTLLSDSEQRLRDAEASRVFAGYGDVGPRITQIFELAEAETRDLKRRALAEHQTLIEQLEHDRARIRRDVENLERRRDAVVSELRRLSEVLAGAAGQDAERQDTAVLELEPAEPAEPGEPGEPAEDDSQDDPPQLRQAS